LRDDHHTRELYEIGRLLARFEGPELTVPAVMERARTSIHLDSVVLLLGPPPGLPIEWSDSPEALEQSRSRAGNFLTYLNGGGALPASNDSAGARRFMAVPLAVPGSALLGVLQLGGPDEFDERDLAFVSAIASELAVAIARHEAAKELELRRAEAARQCAELQRRRMELEAQLWSSEWLRGHYESMVDRMDGAFVWQAHADTLAIVYVSAGAEATLGYPLSEWFGRSFSARALPEEDRPNIERKLRGFHSLGGDRRILHRAVDAQGHIRWLQTAVHAGPGPRGDVVLHGISVDVTDILVEAEQKESELQLGRALMGQVSEGVLAVDKKLNITFMNEAAATLLGVRREEMAGKPIDSVLEIRRSDGCVQTAAQCPLNRCLRTGEPVDGPEVLVVGKHASPFLATFACSPIAGRTGVGGVAFAFRNILEVKRAERIQRFLADVTGDLGASLEYRATLSAFTHLSVPFFADLCVIDEVAGDGSVTRSEIAFADASKQYLADELRRVVPDSFERTPQSRVLSTGKAALFKDIGRDALNDVPQPEVQASVLRVFGARSMIIVPLATRNRRLGVVTFVTGTSGRSYHPRDVGVAQTLAARAAMAIENGREYARVKEAAEKRQEILAVVSHDLRAPLSNIVMSAQHLSDSGAGAPGSVPQLSLEIIQRSVKRMDRMLRDLLDASSIETGKLSVNLAPSRVSALLTDIREAVSAQAHERSVVIETPRSDDDYEVLCDRERIGQVLVNLVGNAIKFTPIGGKVVLDVKRKSDSVVFEVRDRGPGIPNEKVARVFDRFWRGGEAAGTGLGLFIAKGIVTSHGGEIWIDSESGKGTSVFFSLSVAPFSQRPAYDHALPASAFQAKHGLVLVVDDDPTMRNALAAILESRGLRVVTATNGADALSYLHSGELPSLIVLDLVMPVMDGWSFLTQQRRSLALRSIPVIVTSADQDAGKDATAVASDFLRKPIQPDEFLDKISQVLH